MELQFCQTPCIRLAFISKDLI
uniref:Uncharacterized protein n=1 Tax=Anguilla anguilla TaxID=7936 RepID=A0A0E9UDZ0_ANGAN